MAGKVKYLHQNWILIKLNLKSSGWVEGWEGGWIEVKAVLKKELNLGAMCCLCATM